MRKCGSTLELDWVPSRGNRDAAVELSQRLSVREPRHPWLTGHRPLTPDGKVGVVKVEHTACVETGIQRVPGQQQELP